MSDVREVTRYVAMDGSEYPDKESAVERNKFIQAEKQLADVVESFHYKTMDAEELVEEIIKEENRIPLINALKAFD